MGPPPPPEVALEVTPGKKKFGTPQADQRDIWWQNFELLGPPPPNCGQTK